MKENNKNILVIGTSKMGKTHFGGQLYGRLKTSTHHFQLATTPRDLSLFEDILNNLNQGLEGRHTDARQHETVVLSVISENGIELDLVYPDYGGEQLRVMIEQRQINEKWQEQIHQSNHWFLFIRLDLVENIADVTTRFYQQIEEEKEVANMPAKNINDLPENSSAFYVELLQVLLSIKQISLTASCKPRLTVLLSCWDKLMKNEGFLPVDALKEKMPMFFNFIQSVWNKELLQILGLSSLGRDLSKERSDVDYAIEGPENFGYIILPDGRKEEDITLVLNCVVA